MFKVRAKDYDLFVLTFKALAEVLACQLKLSFSDSALLF